MQRTTLISPALTAALMMQGPGIDLGSLAVLKPTVTPVPRHGFERRSYYVPPKKRQGPRDRDSRSAATVAMLKEKAEAKRARQRARNLHAVKMGAAIAVNPK